MKVLVTGGAGFIGSHLCDALLDMGHSVVVVDNLSSGRLENINHIIENIKFIKADIGDIDQLTSHLGSELQDVEIVYHLAALADIVPSIEHPDSYYLSNVTGTFNILQLSIRYGIKKIIYSASSSCYGLPLIHPTSEDAEISPMYPYALTKRLGEELVLHWESIYGINAISLRFFNVYGERSRTSGAYGAVMGVFLAQKLAGKPFTVVGDGSQTRDFTYVKDVVNAVITAGESNVSGEIFNVGSGATYSINHLTDLLVGDKVYIPRRPGEPECTFADISKIKEVLGWVPKYILEEGVEIVKNNINYWGNAPVWTPDTISEATKSWFKYLGKKN